MIRRISIAVLALLSVSATMPPPLPVAKPAAKISAADATTKGAGAKALTIKAAVIPSKPIPRYFFAVAAYNSDGQGPYSAETIYTNTAKATTVYVSWGSVASGALATGYRAYLGYTSSVYVASFDAHGATKITVPLAPTNLVVSVTATTGTNLGYSTDMKSWTLINTNNYTATNGPYRPYWRAYGTKESPGRATITVRHQY